MRGRSRGLPQKPPPATQLHDVATEELRELVRLRERLQEDFALIEVLPHLKE